MEQQTILGADAPRQPHQLAYYMKGKKHGTRFKIEKQAFDTHSEKKEQQLEKMGGEPGSLFLAWVAAIISLMLCSIEMVLCKTSIAASVDVPEYVALCFGVALCALGILCGKRLSEIKRDEFSGSVNFRSSKNLATVGLTLLYIGLQFGFAFYAEQSIGDAEVLTSVTSVKWVIIAVAIIEILCGYLFANRALHTLAVFFLDRKIKSAYKHMFRQARMTDEAWMRYEYDNPGVVLNPEPPVVQEARLFYAHGGTIDNSTSHI